MTSAWMVGAATGVPQDESVVRSTVEPIRTDPEVAEQNDAPDWNEFDSDESGQLTGLANREAGSATVNTVKYTPGWLSLAIAEHNVIIDRQVATSGTAAKREEAGQAGHGTMKYEQGIEPVIRDGSAFGNDYFLSGQNVIQEGAGMYMTPPDTDNWLSTVAQQAAMDNSRKAFQASQYSNFLTGG